MKNSATMPPLAATSRIIRFSRKRRRFGTSGDGGFVGRTTKSRFRRDRQDMLPLKFTSNTPSSFSISIDTNNARRRPKMRRRESLLWNALLGTRVYLLDSLRHRLSESMEDISDRARDTYSEASRRVSRASDVIRGEEHSVLGTAGALLLGVGVGVGLGLLLAPASGEETRGTITSKV